MRTIAPFAALALLAGCAAAPARDAGPAPYRTAPSPMHSENGQIEDSKAVTGRRPSVATTPGGSAYAGILVAPP